MILNDLKFYLNVLQQCLPKEVAISKYLNKYN